MKTPSLQFFLVLTLLAMVSSSGPALVTAAPAAAPLAATTTYPPDLGTVFTNPERGFHNRYEIINDPSVSDYTNFDSSGCGGSFTDRTFACAKAAGDTLIHSYIHLDKYTAVDLPQALLDNLSSGLAAVRAAGLKIVLRPAYVWGGSPNVPEAQIIRHIDQLNAVISANADVVEHLEAGYLGQWGEWHDGLYVVDPASQPESDNRYRIAKKILSTVPATIPVAFRYPVYIKELMDRTVAPPGGTLLTQAEKDRIGFHNDCFLYNENDRGSYDKTTWMGTFTIAQEEQWMYDLSTSYGGNKMVGGETCDGSGRNDSAGVTVQSEMAALNFTEINLDYWVGNINIWKAANLSASGNDPAETAFVRLQRKMGYRLRLVDATFPTSATAGAGFTFSANLSNDGYAGLIKPRPIFLVFTNSAYRFNLPLSNVEVRTWLSGPVALSQQTVTLPANMPAGTYKLSLWLPDYYTGVQSRPEYSIRLANQGIWDSVQGYNVLSTAISITGSGSATATPMPTNTSTPSPTNTPTTTPTPMGYAAYEAESSSNTLAGGAVVAACGPCSGGNKVGYVGNNAGTLQFNGVSTSNGGNYTLTIYYTNGDSVSRAATISVNGGTGTSLNFPATGGWTTIGSVVTTISLNAGSSNTIKFSNATGWAPDFDRITINASGGATSTPAPTATQTNTPTNTVPPTATPTPTNTLVSATNTPTNTPVATATPTNTPLGPTNTPTNTPVGPTNTPTNTPVPPTATPTPTNTPVGPTNTPTNTPSGGTAYEAEAPGNTLGGGATIQNCTACSGGQRVNSIGWGINNAYLIFNNVNVATAGNHTVVVYYTNGNNTSLTFHADPNGTSGPTTTVPSNGGFDWTQPVLSVNITLNLNAGNNTIRIWDNAKAPDIDRIVVQ